MATHRCVTECFHNSHLYTVGEEATFGPREKVPEHFEPIKAVKGKPDAADGDKDENKPDAAE